MVGLAQPRASVDPGCLFGHSPEQLSNSIFYIDAESVDYPRVTNDWVAVG